jgi:hypothetical protein
VRALIDITGRLQVLAEIVAGMRESGRHPMTLMMDGGVMIRKSVEDATDSGALEVLLHRVEARVRERTGAGHSIRLRVRPMEVTEEHLELLRGDKEIFTVSDVAGFLLEQYPDWLVARQAGDVLAFESQEIHSNNARTSESEGPFPAAPRGGPHTASSTSHADEGIPPCCCRSDRSMAARLEAALGSDASEGAHAGMGTRSGARACPNSTAKATASRSPLSLTSAAGAVRASNQMKIKERERPEVPLRGMLRRAEASK